MDARITRYLTYRFMLAGRVQRFVEGACMRISSMPLRVRVRTLAVVLAGHVALSLTLVAPAMAACAPVRSHDNMARYVGTIETRTSLTGVKATIKEYNPYYSGSNGTGTNATVMLARRAGGQVAWAQWGWFKSEIDNGTPQRQVGLEFYVSSSDNRFHFWPGEPVGALTEYKLLYLGGGVYDFRADGVRFDTESGISGPTEYQMFGETHDRADQMPGGVNTQPRDVLVIVVTGGTMPFGGPAGENLADHQARVTGVILDAKTGAFMRGFMFS